MNASIKSLILFLCFYNAVIAEDFIPDSIFMPINVFLDENYFTQRVKIARLENPVNLSPSFVSSPKKYYSFLIDEKQDPQLGNSCKITIISPLQDGNTIITITGYRFNGVKAVWINDKYLLVSAWISRIANLQFIIDCSDRSVKTCELEYYNGDMVRQQKEESDALLKPKK